MIVLLGSFPEEVAVSVRSGQSFRFAKMWVSTFAVLVLCAAAGYGARVPGSKFPSWLNTCYRDDPKLNECAMKSGRDALPTLVKGDRKYRVPVMDPMQILEIKLDRKATNLGLDIHMWDVSLVGLKDTVLKDINFDMKGQHMAMTVFIPHLQILSTYNISGQILILPVTGSGPGNITLLDTQCDYSVKFDLVKNKKDGKDYISLKQDNLDFDTKRAHIKLENLFNGDKLLGTNMNNFLNENWKDMVREVGPALARALSQVMTQILVTVAEVVPYDEVFPLTPKKKL